MGEKVFDNDFGIDVANKEYNHLKPRWLLPDGHNNHEIAHALKRAQARYDDDGKALNLVASVLVITAFFIGLVGPVVLLLMYTPPVYAIGWGSVCLLMLIAASQYVPKQRWRFSSRDELRVQTDRFDKLRGTLQSFAEQLGLESVAALKARVPKHEARRAELKEQVEKKCVSIAREVIKNEHSDAPRYIRNAFYHRKQLQDLVETAEYFGLQPKSVRAIFEQAEEELEDEKREAHTIPAI